MSLSEYWTKKRLIGSGRYSLTKGQLDHFLLYRHRNGLERACRKVGKVLLIRMDQWEEWLESQRKQK